VSPYLGLDTLVPFLDQAVAHGGGLFVLVRTTNPGSSALQHHGAPALSEVVATGLADAGAAHVGAAGLGPVGAVVGAFADEDARRLRALLPHGWFLVPGVGAQGGTVDQALAGVREDGLGVLPVASRSVLFPSEDSVEYDADPGAHIARQAEVLASVVRAGLDRRLG
jgi:orotidine-5'-phosphate decarboxylase